VFEGVGIEYAVPLCEVEFLLIIQWKTTRH